MQVEHAHVSLQGRRDDNQDRAAIDAGAEAVLLVVIDGMGGHSEGALAAETSLQLLLQAFRDIPKPLFDPLGFLHLTLGQVHDAIVQLGLKLPLEQRPRATCAVCLVQGDHAYWAHIGDSRIYHLRTGAVVERTRDHSHVEFLIREGVITADQAQAHPMRNYVECCVGGEPILPEMSIISGRQLLAGDVLLVCSDGLWGHMDDAALAGGLQDASIDITTALKQLATNAVTANGASSDNTTAAALRWLAPA